MSTRQQFELWAVAEFPYVQFNWNEQKHRYQDSVAALMFAAWMQSSVSSHQSPERQRRKQKPFSPAVKERISSRYKAQREEKLAPFFETIRQGILAGKTLREISQLTPFTKSCIHKYILGNEELSRLWNGGEPEKSDE
jgi:hypothetical protein